MVAPAALTVALVDGLTLAGLADQERNAGRAFALFADLLDRAALR